LSRVTSRISFVPISHAEQSYDHKERLVGRRRPADLNRTKGRSSRNQTPLPGVFLGGG
jgi:hypothetical protein